MHNFTSKKGINKKLIIYSSIFLLCYISTVSAEGTNYLAGMFEDVKVMAQGPIKNMIYLGEVVTSAVAYMKTKQIMLLAGLPIIMMFTSFGLGKAGM